MRASPSPSPSPSPSLPSSPSSPCRRGALSSPPRGSNRGPSACRDSLPWSLPPSIRPRARDQSFSPSSRRASPNPSTARHPSPPSLPRSRQLLSSLPRWARRPLSSLPRRARRPLSSLPPCPLSLLRPTPHCNHCGAWSLVPPSLWVTPCQLPSSSPRASPGCSSPSCHASPPSPSGRCP
jgi:hypothetical protein